MSDKVDHAAEAERLLAIRWGGAGEGEMACHAAANTHALLAIVDELRGLRREPKP